MLTLLHHFVYIIDLIQVYFFFTWPLKPLFAFDIYSGTARCSYVVFFSYYLNFPHKKKDLYIFDLL